MRVLGIESSCDETGVAIYDSEYGLMAHQLHSQVALHRKYGGVVPELASRNHVHHLVPLCEAAFAQANCSKTSIDAIAYTAGPGLIGALLTGASFAKALALSLDIPALAVHHVEGHLLAAQLECQDWPTPYLALLVAGGHSQIIEVQSFGSYRLLGETLDDAVGEAFDKTAKMMGLPYPGGPVLADLADSCPEALRTALAPFPRPMTDRPGLDMSFSGLKTHALNTWRQSAQDDAMRQAIAYAFQEAVIDTLLIKLKRAIRVTGHSRFVIAGGVGANKALRKALEEYACEAKCQVLYPKHEFCTDNGAMIAFAGWQRFTRGQCDENTEIHVKARWPLVEDTPE